MKDLLILVLFVLNISVLGAQQGNFRMIASYEVQKGDRFLRFGDLEQAEFSYTNAIAKDPSYAEAYMKRAAFYQHTGRYLESLKDYNQALQINPYSEYIYNKRSKIKLLAMDYRGAIEDINKAIEIDPLNDQLRDERVNEFIEMGAYENALEDIDSLISKGFNLETELLKKSMIFLITENYMESEKNANEVLKMNARSSIAYDILGLIALKKSDFPKAIALLTEAVKINPEFEIAYYNRAIAYRFNGQNEKAIEDLNKAISVSQDLTHLYFKRALIRKELGDLEGSKEDYDRILSTDNSYVDALYNRAFTNKFLGNFNNALFDAEQILRIDDTKVEHWNLKGNIYLLYDSYAKAINAYAIAIGIDDQNPHSHLNLGLAYLMSYRPIQGCESVQKAIDLGHKEATEIYQGFCNF